MHQAIKLAVKSSTLLANGNSIYETELKQALKAQVSYMRKWPKCPWPPTPGTLSSLSLPALMASWGVLYGQVTEENKAEALFTDGSARYADTT